MNPAKVVRSRVKQLTDLPNVGAATAKDLVLLGIETPAQLVGKDPVELYLQLCRKTKCRQDPCVLDVFLSITDFVAGGKPTPWWEYTAERKRRELLPSDEAPEAKPGGAR
jgi:hypothetical protein